MTQSNQIRKPKIDRWVVLLYLFFLFVGLMAVYANSYDESFTGLINLKSNFGKQLIWAAIALMLAQIISITDSKFFTTIPAGFYIIISLTLLATLFIGHSVKGNKAWIEVGSFQFQPAEFAKVAAALMLAKYFSRDVNMKSNRIRLIALGIFLLPMLLVLLQGDAGSALVFICFFFVLYRFGLPGWILVCGTYLIALFVFALLIDKIILVSILGGIGIITAAFFFRRRAVLILIVIVIFCSAGFVFATDFVLNKVMKEHQRDRVLVMIGKKIDAKGVGYNVRQSMTAIGSGGLFGKGPLKGTLTRYNFVPEQSTDYIFCTIGEEYGFFGSAFLIGLFVVFILRILMMAERQRSTFSRVYAYAVASIFLLHLIINIGMTIGIMPTIGIPLPFISYGGSSLFAFTMLLFILIKLDADRLSVLR